MESRQKTAVILFNLGGPDSLRAVRPFLRNLFYDRKIINLPNPFRFVLAELISRRRETKAKEIYRKLGGKSPILEETINQATYLEACLGKTGSVKVFVAMRYWKPFVEDILAELLEYNPDSVVLLPLYPQYSTVTTGSSLDSWKSFMHCHQLHYPTRIVAAYPEEPGFISAYADLSRPFLEEARQHGSFKVLFSAHGLPEKVIAAGDPYQEHCERTARALAKALNLPESCWQNTYQSRVGPLTWIGPATDDVLRELGRAKTAAVVVPISFVSEHSETRIELDHDYAALASQAGVPYYGRVPTVGVHGNFIQGLATLVRTQQEI